MYVHSARTAHAAHAYIPCAHLLPYHLPCRVLTPSTCGLQGSIYVGPAPPRARARYIEGYLQATAPTRAHTTHMTPYTPLWGGMGPSLEGVRAGYRTTPAQRRAHTQGMEGVYPLCVPHTTPHHTTAESTAHSTLCTSAHTQRVLHTVLCTSLCWCTPPLRMRTQRVVLSLCLYAHTPHHRVVHTVLSVPLHPGVSHTHRPQEVVVLAAHTIL